MSGILSWVASSGVVQGVIIGATLAFLTTILVLDWVASPHVRPARAGLQLSGEPESAAYL